MNETHLTLVGRVATEPNARRTADGTKVVHFRLGSTERRFNPQDATWVDGDSVFVSVSCWRKLAEGIEGTLRKGDPVIVTGRLSTRDYEWEGQHRVAVDVQARAVGPDLSKCAVEVRRRGEDAEWAPAVAGQPGHEVPNGETHAARGIAA
jgi:single-strand DNA-binding protein